MDRNAEWNHEGFVEEIRTSSISETKTIFV